MKILQVCQSFYPCFDSGGVVRVVYEISKCLVSKENKITVYTTNGCTKKIKGNNKNPKNIESIQVFYFKNISQFVHKKLKLCNPYYAAIIARKNIKKFDIIHIHEHRSILAIIIHYYAKKNNIPYIFQAHGSTFHFYQKKGFKKIFDILWGNRIFNDAAKIIALTETESDQYLSMGVSKDKIEIIPNGINLSEYQNLPKKGKFRKKYGIQPGSKIILYLGRINKTKGIDLLVDAFSDLNRYESNVKLVIVGPDDGFLNKINEQINNLKLNNDVLFTGPLYGKEKLEAYLNADVFVTPKFSGFPLTFLESLACGTPIITTTNGDRLNWINENVGYVVEYDKTELKEAISKIIGNEQLKKQFGKHGQELVKTKFNWETISNRIEEFYVKSINKNNS